MYARSRVLSILHFLYLMRDDLSDSLREEISWIRDDVRQLLREEQNNDDHHTVAVWSSVGDDINECLVDDGMAPMWWPETEEPASVAVA